MLFQGIELCCPLCKNDLSETGDKQQELRCDRCNKRYPIFLGIPDLRVFSDPYLSIEADRAKGLRLAERFNDLDFSGLVDFYYSTTAVVPPKHAQQYKRGLMAGEARAEAALNAWEKGRSENRSQPVELLEMGCGTAPLLVAASRRFTSLVGIDIAFRWLVVGKKRLEQAGLNVPLICACAEALPLRDETFDRIVADSVIEHVRDQFQVLREAYRVSRPEGQLFIATPNRFSLGPDPHIGLWAGGFIPKRWLDAYVSRLGGRPPHRQLVTSQSLKRLILNAGFAYTQIYCPEVPRGQRVQLGQVMNWLIDLYHMFLRFPGSQPLLRCIGPSLHAVSKKRRVVTG